MACRVRTATTNAPHSMTTDTNARVNAPIASDLPVLYSFRRCPYAMRARMALIQSNTTCELREIVLRNKPDAMLAASAKGTVPVLVLPNGTVIDESLDIMYWALGKHDPDNWLRNRAIDDNNANNNRDGQCPARSMQALITHFDAHFKHHLDRYKYATRYQHDNDGAGADPLEHRAQCLSDLTRLDEQLAGQLYLFGEQPSLADIALAPFVRQFANTDLAWFDSAAPDGVRQWLDRVLSSNLFAQCMHKYSVWPMTGPGESFPPLPASGVK